MRTAKKTVLALVLAGCASRDVVVRASDDFAALRGGGYRIAVLPFQVSADTDGFLTDALAGVGSIAALDGLSDQAPANALAGAFMRRALVASLRPGAFQVAELWASDTELAHRNLLDAARDPARARELAAALDVDAVLFGDVHYWNRSYYIAEAVQKVGLRIDLVDRRTGQTVFHGERTEYKGTGVTSGPTGYLSAITAPVQGLKGSTLVELARSVARDLAGDFTGMESVVDLDRTAASGNVPRLSFCSVSRPHAGDLVAGDLLTVVAVGTAAAEARFDLGRYRVAIPMVEVKRSDDARGERSTYVGTYVVQPGERLPATPVFVSLRTSTKAGATTSVRRVPQGEVAFGG